MSFDQIVESSEPILTPSGNAVFFEEDIIEWPWPRIMATDYRTLAFFKINDGRLLMFEMALTPYQEWEGYPAGDLGAAEDVHSIHIADFGPFYMVSTNGVVNHTYMRDVVLTNDNVDRDVHGFNLVDELSSPICGTICNNKGQLIGANLQNWQNLGTNGILWSAIGNLEFSPENDVTAGFRELISNNATGEKCVIYKLLPLQEGIVCYTNHGNIILTDELVNNTFTYSVVPLQGLGIASANHAAGSKFVQGYINLNNEFCRINNQSFRTVNQEGGKVIRLGYKKYIEDMMELNDNILVSYEPLRNTFYISNGITTLLINDFGACTTHQAISGVVRGWNKKRYGTFRELGDKEARITLDGNDFDSTGLKTLENILVGYVTSNQKAYASTYWRNKNREEFKTSKWKNINERGEVHLGVTAREFRITIRVPSYIGTNFESIRAGIKYSDARFRRGLASASNIQQTQG